MEIAFIPRFITRRLFIDDVSQIHINILLSSAIIILFFYFLGGNSTLIGAIPHVCLVEKMTGLPCPGCGIISSLTSAANGKYFSAWQHNPAGLLLFVFVIMQIPMRYIALRRVSTSVAIIKFSRWLSVLLVVFLFLVWICRLIYLLL